MRFLQLAKMTESPSDLVAVAFPIITVVLRGAQNFGNVFTHTGFLCDTYNHAFLFFIIAGQR